MSKLKYYDGTNWKIVNGQVTGDTLPIGAIVPFGGWDAPTGWLICDGTLLSKTDYPELFNAIGYSFGGEEGGNTFGLPDLRGRVPLGLKETDTDFNGMGLTGGEKTHQLTVNEMPSHNHNLNKSMVAAMTTLDGVNDIQQIGGQRIYEYITINNTGGDQPHNNLQPYQTVNYIIKATQSAGLVANVSNIQSESTTDTYSCDYINGELNDINTKLYDSGWKTATLQNGWTNISNRTMKYRRIGNVVYIQGTISGGTYTAGTTLFTLPEGFRNTMPYQKFVGEYYSSGAQVGFIYVYNNGIVALDTALPGNSEFSFSISYVAN